MNHAYENATGILNNTAALDRIAREAHDNAVAHGFYRAHEERRQRMAANNAPDAMMDGIERDFTLAQIAKIASECGEAVSALQHDDNGALAEELADVIIRTLDLAAYLEITIGDEVAAKMAINKTREYLHGKKC